MERLSVDPTVTKNPSDIHEFKAFADQYRGQNPESSDDEVINAYQAQKDAAYYAQSDVHIRNQAQLTGTSSFDGETASKYDEQVASGTYNGFRNMRDALIDSPWSEKLPNLWNAMTYERPDAELIRAQLMQPNPRAAVFDSMLASPFSSMGYLAARAGGASNNNALKYGAGAGALIGAMVDIGGGARVRANSASAALRRSYLNEKFGRTGDLNADINLRGAQDAARQAAFDRLAAEGHAVGRHGPRVTGTALDIRAMYKIDPMTGTTTDFYTGMPHAASKNATQFLGQSMLAAEQYARNSPEFGNKMTAALMNGKSQFAVNGLHLEDALGPNYLSYVYGKQRLGSVNNPTGTAPIDFTNGTYTSVFKKNANGYWNLHTMYPEPQ